MGDQDSDNAIARFKKLSKASSSSTKKVKVKSKSSSAVAQSNNSYIRIILLLIALGVLTGAALYYLNSVNLLEGGIGLNQGDSANEQLTEQQAAELSETEIIARIGEIYRVPQNEKPYVQSINNVDNLKADNPEFYANAVNGNNLVIYTQSKIAIIYDPITNKIVYSGKEYFNPVKPTPTPTPIPQDTEDSDTDQTDDSADSEDTDADDTTPTPTATPVAVEEITVEIRNGSGVAGLASKAKTAITSGSDGDAYAVTKTANAANFDYATTIIVDQSEDGAETLVKGLTAEVNGKAQTSLPTGEASSTADVIVILGKDYAN